MSTNVELLDFLNSKVNASEVLKGSAAGDDISKLNKARDSLATLITEKGPAGAFDAQDKRIANLRSSADSARDLFTHAEDVTKGFEKATEHLNADNFTQAKTSISKSVTAAEAALKKINEMPAPKHQADIDLRKKYTDSLSATIKEGKVAEAKLGSVKKPAAGKEMTEASKKALDAAKTSIGEATSKFGEARTGISNHYDRAAKSLDKAAAGKLKMLKGERDLAKVTLAANSSVPEAKRFSGAKTVTKIEKDTTHGHIQKATKEAEEIFTKEVDTAKLEKLNPKSHIKSAERASEGASSSASKASKAAGKGWMEKIKGNFGKDVGMGTKFARVAGTGIGGAMIVHGIGTSKTADGQDRSGMGRLLEVAAGVGIAGASLAGFAASKGKVAAR